MKDLKVLLENELSCKEFTKCVISSPRIKGQLVRSIIVYKTSEQKTLKVEFRYEKHNDIKSIDIADFFTNHLIGMLTEYKQIHLLNERKEVHILINKKLIPNIKTKILEKSTSKKHNNEKKYLIPDGEPCDFLIEIGVMGRDGKVKPNYYKKFRQINRFLEMVDDLYKKEDLDSLHIVDFGCGKSYLTFALYFYFSKIKNISTLEITGIDLKQEVIDHCNEIAQKINYDQLKFVHGFIHDFKTDRPVDFVVTLHACDTATDDAILFSLAHNASKMMFVPCCQHELNKQLSCSHSAPLLSHGILRDRQTALVTDSMRSQLLEVIGYKVHVMEFIDMEHTAKNILLRCVKTDRPESQRAIILKKYEEFREQWGINPYLESKCRELGYLVESDR